MAATIPVILAVAAVFVIFGIRNLARHIRRLRAADPEVWESVVRAYEAQERRQPPPLHPVVFTGSSTIYYWKTLAEDMAPLPVLGRGFGGSRIHQVTHFVDRLITPHEPVAVVLYAGENEISGALLSPRKSAEEVAADFLSFCERVHRSTPGIPVFYLSIKPPVKRSQYAHAMADANRRIAEACRADPLLSFVDVSPALTGADGRVRRELYRHDGIHLNASGYRELSSIVRQALRADPRIAGPDIAEQTKPELKET